MGVYQCMVRGGCHKGTFLLRRSLSKTLARQFGYPAGWLQLWQRNAFKYDLSRVCFMSSQKASLSENCRTCDLLLNNASRHSSFSVAADFPVSEPSAQNAMPRRCFKRLSTLTRSMLRGRTSSPSAAWCMSLKTCELPSALVHSIGITLAWNY